MQKKSQSPAQKNRSWEEVLFPTLTLPSLSELRYDKRVRQVGSKGLPWWPSGSSRVWKPFQSRWTIEGPWSIPGWGAKISCTFAAKKPKHKQQKKCCKKFNKGFKTVGSKYHHLINSGRLGDMA